MQIGMTLPSMAADCDRDATLAWCRGIDAGPFSSRACGGPPIWAGAMGPKSLARAARWADGVSGFSVSGDPDEISRAFEAAGAAWRDAGRDERPRRVTGFWYALGEGAKQRLEGYVYDYLRIFGEGPARALARRMRIHSAEAFRDAVAAIEAVGCDELILVPTSSDPSELERTIEVLS
jgi:alkanesulfonate monooxygenase SsuD/methylene tetrahydromethanopterin reductase-like flavin-dependent oxidoreductase (luciferase family)